MGWLSRKVALITGASSGIGAETAVQMAGLGAHLALTGRDVHELDEVKQKCTAQGLAEDLILLLPGDLTEDAFLEDIVNKTAEHFGSISILVNCAGQLCLGSLESTTMDKFDEVFNINMRAPFVLMQLVLPHLIRSKGAVVNVSSCLSASANPNILVYCMSKAGIDGLTYTTSEEYAEHGVRVNAVNPGASVSPLCGRSGTEIDKVTEMSKRRHPLGHPDQVSEVAKTILFLASDAAAMVTGFCMSVDGGRRSAPGAPLKPLDEVSPVKFPI